MIAGVCGGVGRRLGIDPVILRVVVVVLAFFAGAGILLYAAAWLFMPLDQTNQSLVSEALGSDSTDRVRNVLTAGALLAVIAISALFALDGGFVPGLLIALVVVAVLLVVRRDEHVGRPAYAPPGAFPPPPATGSPTYGGSGYAQPQDGGYGAPPAGATAYGGAGLPYPWRWRPWRSASPSHDRRHRQECAAPGAGPG